MDTKIVNCVLQFVCFIALLDAQISMTFPQQPLYEPQPFATEQLYQPSQQLPYQQPVQPQVYPLDPNQRPPGFNFNRQYPEPHAPEYEVMEYEHPTTPKPLPHPPPPPGLYLPQSFAAVNSSPVSESYLSPKVQIPPQPKVIPRQIGQPENKFYSKNMAVQNKQTLQTQVNALNKATNLAHQQFFSTLRTQLLLAQHRNKLAQNQYYQAYRTPASYHATQQIYQPAYRPNDPVKEVYEMLTKGEVKCKSLYHIHNYDYMAQQTSTCGQTLRCPAPYSQEVQMGSVCMCCPYLDPATMNALRNRPQL